MRLRFSVAACAFALAGCRGVVGFDTNDDVLAPLLKADAGPGDDAGDAGSGPPLEILRAGQGVAFSSAVLAACPRLRIRMWGAGGGNFEAEEQMTVPGGPGGFTEIVLEQAAGAEPFHYWVGSAGTLASGGLPGGARGGPTKGIYLGPGGGGYSAIALADGTLLAVAGGGGGACFQTDGTGGMGRGGAGGGTSALSGGGTYPGLGASTQGGNGAAAMNAGAAGVSLAGGVGGGNLALFVPPAGGGGGGLFGGGGGGTDEEAWCGAGGGGSGFVESARIVSGATVTGAIDKPPEFDDVQRTAVHAGESGKDGLIVVRCDE
jgi:hypothetical protein